MDKFKIDENYFLIIYADNDNKLKITEELLNEMNEHIFFNKNKEFFEGKISNIISDETTMSFKFCNIPFEVLDPPISCNFIKEKKIISVFSRLHLKLILKKLNYNSPYYLEKDQKIFLDVEKINLLNEQKLIIINNEDKNKELISNYFNQLKELYTKHYVSGKSTYEFISVNFNKYFLINVDLKRVFFYFKTKERGFILGEINKFLEKDNKEQLLGFCGPYGIGKSITSLFIQKALYFSNKKKSIYINLKYYYNQKIKNEEKEITFIKECYFLIDNSKELYDIFQKIALQKKSIWAMIEDTVNYLFEQNKNEFYLIIDQYKQKFDKENNLKNLKQKVKIIILSSINDKDVKTNLINSYKKEINQQNFEINFDNDDIINYIYILNLFKINELNLNIFFTDAKGDEINLAKNHLNNLFGNIPKYINLYLYYYKDIVELYNQEYVKIFRNIDFFLQANINDDFFKTIDNKEKLNEQNFITKIRNMPLKYINYLKNENEKTYILYYSFPLVKTILNDYNNFIKRKKSYYSEDNQSTKGNNFEAVLKVILRIYKILPNDGYFEVEDLIKMNLTNIYAKIDNNYFLKKKIILINQINRSGELYDFALYYVKEQNLILFQAKYIINSKNIKHRDEYIDSSKKIKELFEKKFDIDLKGVYLLYISDKELNETNSKIPTILGKNELTCLFFSIQDKNFTFDFLHIIDEIIFEKEFRIIPKGNYTNKLLESQLSFGNFFKKRKLLLPPGITEKMKFNLRKEYKKFITYVRKNHYIKDDIKNYLGNFAIFYYNFGEYYDKEDIKIKYYLAVSVKESDENNLEIVINYDEEIGLVYYNDDDKEQYLIVNKDYKEMEGREFRSKFYYNCLIKGIWKKYLD